MSQIKGYVVRGKGPEDGRAESWSGLDTPDDATSAHRRMVATGCTDVRIFVVAEDGTETPLGDVLAEVTREEEALRLAHGARVGGAR